MTEKQTTDVVVIGAGYAGLMAAMRIVNEDRCTGRHGHAREREPEFQRAGAKSPAPDRPAPPRAPARGPGGEDPDPVRAGDGDRTRSEAPHRDRRARRGLRAA